MSDVTGEEEGEEAVEVGGEPGQDLGGLAGTHFAVRETRQKLEESVNCSAAREVSVWPVSLASKCLQYATDN